MITSGESVIAGLTLHRLTVAPYDTGESRWFYLDDHKEVELEQIAGTDGVGVALEYGQYISSESLDDIVLSQAGTYAITVWHGPGSSDSTYELSLKGTSDTLPEDLEMVEACRRVAPFYGMRNCVYSELNAEVVNTCGQLFPPSRHLDPYFARDEEFNVVRCLGIAKYRGVK